MKHAALPQTRENNKNQFLNLTSDMIIPNTPFIKLKHQQRRRKNSPFLKQIHKIIHLPIDAS